MILAGRRAWLVTGALVVSLTLNLFAGGVLIGRTLLAGPARPDQGSAAASHLRGLGRLVPAGARPVMQERLKEHEAVLAPQLEALRAARREAFALLRAEPFDPAATRAAFASLRERSLAVQMLIQDLLVETAQRTPPEIRAAWGPEPGQGRTPPP